MPEPRPGTGIATLRWMARATGIVLFGFWGAFFLGHLAEFSDVSDLPPFTVWLAMFALLIMLSGFLIAWKYEATGAIMVIAGAVALFIDKGRTARFVYLPTAALPALVHLYCRWKGGAPPED